MSSGKESKKKVQFNIDESRQAKPKRTKPTAIKQRSKSRSHSPQVKPGINTNNANSSHTINTSNSINASKAANDSKTVNTKQTANAGKREQPLNKPRQYFAKELSLETRPPFCTRTVIEAPATHV